MKAILKSKKFGFTEEITIPYFLPVIWILLPKELTFLPTENESDWKLPPNERVGFYFIGQDTDGTYYYEEQEKENEK